MRILAFLGDKVETSLGGRQIKHKDINLNWIQQGRINDLTGWNEHETGSKKTIFKVSSWPIVQEHIA